MKRIVYLLIGWNLIALAMIGLKYATANGASRSVVIPERTLRHASAAPLSSGLPGSSPSIETAPWQAVESDNYQIYMENLRATGCPEETIRDIIISDVSKNYEMRLKGGQSMRTNAFWESGFGRRGNAGEAEHSLQARQLRMEKAELLGYLLGQEWDREETKPFRDPYEKGFLGTLSPDKKLQITAITEKYSELREDVFRKGNGSFDQDLRSDLAALSSAQRRELAESLTPSELEQWELRYSDTARNIRLSSGDFEPTEAEFKTIFCFRQMTEAVGSQSAEPEKFLKSNLGETRYADYKREQDRDFQNLKKVVHRFGIEAIAAEKVHELKTSTQAAFETVAGDPHFNAEQRQGKLLEIKESVTQKITTILGDRAAKSYLRDAGWVQKYR